MNSVTSYRRSFDQDHLLQISMPMGGIGAGCICLSGHGALQDFSIRHHPATTALMDGHGVEDAAFGVIHIKGEEPQTRLLEGPVPSAKIYNLGLQGQGYRKGGQEGFPRFQHARFEAQFPSGYVYLTDDSLPLEVVIEGWSPMIPGDDVNSCLPCSVVNYTFTNRSDRRIEAEFSFHMCHLAPGKRGESVSRNKAVPRRGVYLFNEDDPDSVGAGNCALYLLADDLRIKAEWFRGGWFDGISALWKQVSTGTFTENLGEIGRGPKDGRNGGSVLAPFALEPGESKTVPVVLSWYFPNCALNVGGAASTPETWSPFYVSHWSSAKDVADYVREHYASLKRKSDHFRDALYSSTLPHEFLDAIGANLAILKSPTILRQANGNVWAWEGCFPDRGCCHGSCTHVWNYAQALAYLYPKLERTLREQEFERSMDERGHVNFRAALPDGPTKHDFHAAADGQLGGILKLYRDWQICGDTQWLLRLYPLAKRSLDYCIRTWDPDERGALDEPHHNTYDIEFWGPDGMCGSIYVGALAALAEMAVACGDADADRYRALSRRAAVFLDEELFNGAFYEQRVEWMQTRDGSFRELLAAIGSCEVRDEMQTLLLEEGPKYQYGKGCLSDGVIGAWMAEIYGVGSGLDQGHVRAHLDSIFRHNFRHSLKDHPCLQRPGYAIGDEPGLILCTWPNGGKPTLPFVYSDEVWTGIEYQVASHMLAVGMVEEAASIVGGVRSRYDGLKRNPFNEYECGNYYARALASYALLNEYGGFRYSAVNRSLRLAPKSAVRPFRSFFSTDNAHGTFEIDDARIEIELLAGSLVLESIETPDQIYRFPAVRVSTSTPFEIRT